MKKILLFATLLACSAGMTAQELITAPDLYDISSTRSKSNDFGLSFNLGLEKKIVPGFSFELESELRTQDNSSMIERIMVGGGLSYRFYQSMDRRFSIKAGAGFQFIWRQVPSSIEDFDRTREHFNNDLLLDGYTHRKGYQTTDSYWRNRHRTNLSLTASFSPNKRWSFTLKETFQYSHYISTDSLPRMRHNEEYNRWRESGDYADAEMTQPLYYDTNLWGINGDGDFYTNPDMLELPFDDENNKAPRKSKDKLVLRSKFTVKYNVKGIPLNPYASVDYGAGLNYTAHKWKFSVGSTYKIQKKHELDLFYRYSHDNDDDEPNGHLLGFGYKFNF